MSFIFNLLFLCAILMSTSCTDRSQYDFRSSEDALRQYNSLFHTISDQSTCNAEQMANFINQWRELSDTVYRYIQKDPSFSAHAGLSHMFMANTDSIRAELLRLSDNCTLSDVAYVKLNTSKFTGEGSLDTIRLRANTFFISLDKTPINNKDVRKVLSKYATLLLQMKRKGIHSQKALLDFIVEEDMHFRSFLSNLDKCSSMSMTEITNHTADICTDIYKTASRNKIPADETLVYMSMRTNRRLMLNAKVCHGELKKGKIKDATQANAYLWMMLQPYLSMDSLGIAMLTSEQSQTFTDIAKDFPAILSRLDSKHLIDREVSDKLPAQLMRLYISTL